MGHVERSFEVLSERPKVDDSNSFAVGDDRSDRGRQDHVSVLADLFRASRREVTDDKASGCLTAATRSGDNTAGDSPT